MEPPEPEHNLPLSNCKTWFLFIYFFFFLLVNKDVCDYLFNLRGLHLLAASLNHMLALNTCCK